MFLFHIYFRLIQMALMLGFAGVLVDFTKALAKSSRKAFREDQVQLRDLNRQFETRSRRVNLNTTSQERGD